MQVICPSIAYKRIHQGKDKTHFPPIHKGEATATRMKVEAAAASENDRRSGHRRPTFPVATHLQKKKNKLKEMVQEIPCYQAPKCADTRDYLSPTKDPNCPKCFEETKVENCLVEEHYSYSSFLGCSYL